MIICAILLILASISTIICMGMLFGSIYDGRDGKGLVYGAYCSIFGIVSLALWAGYIITRFAIYLEG